jgi:hypothetical protein
MSSALRGEGEVCGALTLCFTAVAFQSQADLTFVQMPKHLQPEAHIKSNKKEEEVTLAEHKGAYVSSWVPRPSVQEAVSEIALSRLSSSGAGAATSRPATSNSDRATAENRISRTKAHVALPALASCVATGSPLCVATVHTHTHTCQQHSLCHYVSSPCASVYTHKHTRRHTGRQRRCTGGM